MRICIVNPFFDNAPNTFLEVTGRYRHVEALAAALARRGNQVAVVQAFFESKVEHRGDVEFRYAATPWRTAGRLSGGRTGMDLVRRGNLKNILAAMTDFRPDAVHMNGITLLQPLAAIGSWCAKRGLAFTASYHGGEPRRAPWLRSAERTILRRLRRAFFTTREHAEAWISSGLLEASQVIPCMEVSSTFTAGDRASARARTGLTGSPVFVWNAGLHLRKDPVTALKGFSLIRSTWPGARLYMVFLSSEMQRDIEATIAADSGLQESLILLGFTSHRAIEDVFNSADFLIQSSRSEIAGQSVVEAMACGVIPVVTDIPSFRVMTDSGRSGVLFPVGDYQLMASRVLRLSPSDIRQLSSSVLDRFSKLMSYDAIGSIYERELSGNSAKLCSRSNR